MFAIIEDVLASFLWRIARISKISASLLSATMILCLALVIFTPSLTPREHGVFYTEKSMMPLNLSFPNLVQLRFFGPLIGWALGFSGDSFVYFPLLCMFLLLATTCYFLLNSGFEPVTALLGTCCIGLSTNMAVLFQFPGYVDAIAYLFIFLSYVQIKIWARGSRLWGVSMALALLTHESSIALIPYIAWHAIDHQRGDWRRQAKWVLINSLLAVLPLFLFRFQVTVSGAYAASWYLSLENVLRVVTETYRYLPIGIFFSFKAYWSLVVIALYFALLNRDYWFVIGIAVGLCGVLSQLLVAYDTSRLMGLAFPLLITSQVYISRYIETRILLRFFGLLFVIQILIPTYYVGGTMLIPHFPLIISILLESLFKIQM